MGTCSACRRPLDFHTDRDCLEAERARARIARCILRSLMAVPYREFAAAGMTTVVALSMTFEQFQTLKRFAESE